MNIPSKAVFIAKEQEFNRMMEDLMPVLQKYGVSEFAFIGLFPLKGSEEGGSIVQCKVEPLDALTLSRFLHTFAILAESYFKEMEPLEAAPITPQNGFFKQPTAQA